MWGTTALATAPRAADYRDSRAEWSGRQDSNFGSEAGAWDRDFYVWRYHRKPHGVGEGVAIVPQGTKTRGDKESQQLGFRKVLHLTYGNPKHFLGFLVQVDPRDFGL